MHPCQQVNPDSFSRAKRRYVSVVEVDATAEQVFDSFERAEDWLVWAPAIRQVVWTSPKPFGVGTTRTVSMTGLVAEEVFIAWDYPKRMAFCFSGMSQPIMQSFAEDYHVMPLANGKTRIEWTVIVQPKGVGRFTMALFGPFLGIFNQWMLNRLKVLLEQRHRK